MNIKNLSKDYLNTLPGLSEDEKEKIANFNVNSDYIVFSAFSTGPVDIGVTEYDNPETGKLDRFSKDYGGFKKVDADGYILVDESEYNPFYPHPMDVRKLPLERRVLDGINYKRDASGYLKAKKLGVKYSTADKARGEEDGWERFQHLKLIDSIPVGTEVGIKTTRNSVVIESEPLSSLLEEVWNKVADSEDGHDVARLLFTYGAGMINTPSYLNQTRYCVLPNDKTERDKLWVMISKESFKHQTEYNYSLSFDLNDIQKKIDFKLFPNNVSLMKELKKLDKNQHDEIITDEKYNEYIETHTPENNFIVKLFNETRGNFFDNYEQFRQKYPALVDEINAKLNETVIPDDTKRVDDEIWVGRKIKSTDDEATKNSLKKAGEKWIEGGGDIHVGKMLEAIDLMENLFEEASGTPPPPKQPSDKLADLRSKAIIFINSFLNQEPKLSSNDLTENNRNWKELINTAGNEDKINGIKDRVLADIAAKRKTKKQEQKIPEDTQTEGKTKEQLKEQLERVEESRGSQVYENNQVKVDNLKKELSKKISQEEYARIIAQVIEKILVKYKIGYDELDSEIKKQWEKLKSGEIKEFDRVNQTEKEVIDNAGNKGARKKLDSLFRQAESALKTGKDIKKVKNRFNGFMSSNEIYEKSLLSQEAKKIESYLSQLENYSSNHSQSPSRDIPWTMIISIILLVIFVIGIMVYRKRKQRKSY